MAAGKHRVTHAKDTGLLIVEEADQCQTCNIEERDICVLQEADQYLAGVVDREAAAAATQDMPDVMADMQAGEDPCLVR